MKQVIQSLKTGVVDLLEAPAPQIVAGHLLIKTRKTLISAGTEKMLLEFGMSNLLGKAKKHPEQVQRIFEKFLTDGLVQTVSAVNSKMNTAVALGYSNVGTVLEVGQGCEQFRVGDRVVSNGSHASTVLVPKHLCAKVPDNVTDEDAVFTVIASIALNAVRISKPTFGESFVVYGLGIVGLLTCQLLDAAGCRVLGVDPNKDRCEIANRSGIKAKCLSSSANNISNAIHFSRKEGVDGVIIAASTQSNKLINEAAQMCRKKGRITLVGLAGTQIPRDHFFKKELLFQVSCSYGPGRYDEDYEDNGRDYPLGFVRWTEQRNFEAILDALSSRRVKINELVSHDFMIGDVKKAYETLLNDSKALGITLTFGGSFNDEPEKILVKSNSPDDLLTSIASGVNSRVIVSFLGAGNYANKVLMPAFKSAGAGLNLVASKNGISASIAAKKFGFKASVSQNKFWENDVESHAAVIVTDHQSHSEFVNEALKAGKNVFVEKPLCVSLEQLETIKKTFYSINPKPVLMVGFNRRFSPFTKKLKNFSNETESQKTLVINVNAGQKPLGLKKASIGISGGRIVGECCHFIDLALHVIGRSVVDWSAYSVGSISQDSAVITLVFEDGSIATINYLNNGSTLFQKERVELFSNGKVLQVNNFRKMRSFGFDHGYKFFDLLNFSQNKGQKACVKSFLDAIAGEGPPHLTAEEIFVSSELTLKIAGHLQCH